MPKVFDLKTWNEEVFDAYRSTIADPVKTNLINAGIFFGDAELAGKFPDQVGGIYAIKPVVGLLSGDADDLNGATDISNGSLGTLTQGVVVLTKGKAFTEKDFTYNLTGKDFIFQVAEQLVPYWSKQNQKTMLAILKGIFGSALSASVISKSAVSGADIIDAVRSVGGDNADMFKVVFMHSAVASILEKEQLIDYAKYTDPQGIERKTNIGYWGSRLVIVNDLCPSVANPAEYELTEDTDIVAGKDYYTRSGSEGAYVYTKVASPVKTDIATYYEMVSVASHSYTCYVLGERAFCFQELPLLYKTEMSRDPNKNGGQTTLTDRERFILAPEGVSFKQSAVPANLKVTNSVLEDASSWEKVKDSSGNAIDNKIIPFASIVYTIAD